MSGNFSNGRQCLFHSSQYAYYMKIEAKICIHYCINTRVGKQKKQMKDDNSRFPIGEVYY